MFSAISLAIEVSVVLRLTLYAIRKFLAPIVHTPVFAVESFHSLGPKSGFHSGFPSLFGRASYSPSLMFGSFTHSGFDAAYS